MRLDGSITENLDEEQLKNQLMEMQIYPGGNSESKNCVIKVVFRKFLLIDLIVI